VGKRVLRFTRSGVRPLQVVGVVADAREIRVNFRTPHAAWYLPYRQLPAQRDLSLVIRGEVEPARVRSLVHRLDPHQPVEGPRRLVDQVEEMWGSDRMAAIVMGYFAVLAVLLSAVGIHGSMARFVGQQRRAIGIRIALGAEPRRIVTRILGRGLVLAGIGVAIGIAGGFVLQRLAAGFVYDTLIDTPTRLALTGLVTLLVALVACGAPALEAGRTDPARLLRE